MLDINFVKAKLASSPGLLEMFNDALAAGVPAEKAIAIISFEMSLQVMVSLQMFSREEADAVSALAQSFYFIEPVLPAEGLPQGNA